jgi:hypothetical protein
MKKIGIVISLCFTLNLTAQFNLVGPDGPVMNLTHSGSIIHFNLSNPVVSNNYLLQYQEDIFIDSLLASYHPDSSLHFQGYMIYQLLDSSVTWGDLGDTNRVKLIYQCDLVDQVDTLINEETNAFNICGPVVKVNGHNAGITDTFSITINPFTHAPYQTNDYLCFWGVAYAYNPYLINPGCSGLSAPFFPGPRKTTACLNGLAGLENTEIPHLMVFPNPAIHYIEVTGDFENAQIELTNVQGQVLMNKNMIKGEKIPVDELNEGVYILQIKSGMHVSYKRIIVQH